MSDHQHVKALVKNIPDDERVNDPETNKPMNEEQTTVEIMRLIDFCGEKITEVS